jgi:AraC-like DNA-binding protein
MIAYNEFKPHLLLHDYIKSYWWFSIKTTSVQPFDILPDGYFDLIEVIKGDTISNVSLTGVWSKAVEVEYATTTEVFGIRFKPLAINNILRLKIDGLLDTSTALELKDIGLDKQMLLEHLKMPPQLLVNRLNKHFISFLNGNNVDNRTKRLFDIVELSAGNETVSSVAGQIGLSSRQLQRHMKSLIGLGLKEYSKIVRLRKTLRRIQHNKNDFYPYFDQSHFIRELKEYTGYTPQKIDLNNNVRFIQYYNFNNL